MYVEKSFDIEDIIKVIKEYFYMKQYLQKTKILLIFFLLFLFRTNTFNEQITDSVFNSPISLTDNDTVFQNIEDHLRKKTIVRADFLQQKEVKALNKLLKSKGNLVFSQEHGIIWKTIFPVESMIIMTSKGKYFFNESIEKSENRDNKNNMPSRSIKAFLSLFSGNFKKLEKMFSLYFTHDLRRNWTLGLVPQKKSTSEIIDRMIIRGNNSGFITSFILIGKNRGKTIIRFKNLKDYPDTLSYEELSCFEKK